MKRDLTRKILFFALLSWGFAPWLTAQSCPNGPMQYSLLEYLTGADARRSPAFFEWKASQLGEVKDSLPLGLEQAEYLLMAGKAAIAAQKLQAFGEITQGDSLRLAEWHHYLGLTALASQSYQKAAEHFAQGAAACGSDLLLPVAQYLHRYRQKDQSPIFPYFNGGAYNFQEESIAQKKRFVTEDLKRSILVMMHTLEYFNFSEPALLEVLGDLMIRYPNPFQAKWLSALCYFRAGQFSPGEEKTEFYRRKAIYALESDRENPKSFNRFRFVQFTKAFAAETDSAAARQSRRAALEKTWLENPSTPSEQFSTAWPQAVTAARPENDYFELIPSYAGNLIVEQMEKDMKSIKADQKLPNPNAKIMSKELDMREIKTNVRYNVYALGIIGFVIAAVAFFWVQIRRNSRKQ